VRPATKPQFQQAILFSLKNGRCVSKRLSAVRAIHSVQRMGRPCASRASGLSTSLSNTNGFSAGFAGIGKYVVIEIERQVIGDLPCIVPRSDPIYEGSGIYMSTNNGTSWSALNSRLANIHVNYLAVSGTNFFAGTKGGGVWRLPLSEITIKWQP
jgi:hypothetical protein